MPPKKESQQKEGAEEKAAEDSAADFEMFINMQREQNSMVQAQLQMFQVQNNALLTRFEQVMSMFQPVAQVPPAGSREFEDFESVESQGEEIQKSSSLIFEKLNRTVTIMGRVEALPKIYWVPSSLEEEEHILMNMDKTQRGLVYGIDKVFTDATIEAAVKSTKPDALRALFKETVLAYYKRGGNKTLDMLISSAAKESLMSALVLTEKEQMQLEKLAKSLGPVAVAQEIMRLLYEHGCQNDTGNQRFKTGIALLSYSPLIGESVHTDYVSQYGLFRDGVKKLMDDCGVVWNYKRANTILERVKEQFIVKNMRIEANENISAEEFWSLMEAEVRGLVACMSKASYADYILVPRMKYEKWLKLEKDSTATGQGKGGAAPASPGQGKGGGAPASPGKFSPPVCFIPGCKEHHYVVARDGSINCPIAKKDENKFKEIIDRERAKLNPTATKKALAVQGAMAGSLLRPVVQVALTVAGVELPAVHVDTCCPTNIMPFAVWEQLAPRLKSPPLNYADVVELEELTDAQDHYIKFEGVLEVPLAMISMKAYGTDIILGNKEEVIVFAVSSSMDLVIIGMLGHRSLELDMNQLIALGDSAQAAPNSMVLAHRVKAPTLTAELFQVLQKYHNNHEGHVGPARLYRRVQEKHPEIVLTMSQVEEFIKYCWSCQKRRPGGGIKVPKVTLMDRDFSVVCVDIITITFRGNAYYFVAMLHVGSRFITAELSRDKSAMQVVMRILNMGAYIPFYHMILQSDHGPEFVAAVTNEVKSLVFARYNVTSKDSHQENGVIERAFWEIRRHLGPILQDIADKMAMEATPVSEEDMVVLAVHMACHIINNVPTYRGLAPIEVLMPVATPRAEIMNYMLKSKSEAVETLVELQIMVMNVVLEAERKHQVEYMKENKDSEVYDIPDLGTLVLVYTGYTKQTTPWVGPFILKQVKSNNNVVVQSIISDHTFVVHLTKVKRFLQHPHSKLEPKTIAGWDYAQAIVIGVKDHRVVAEGSENPVLEDYEFLIEFASGDLWLAYANCKELEALDVYVHKIGLTNFYRTAKPTAKPKQPVSVKTLANQINKEVKKSSKAKPKKSKPVTEAPGKTKKVVLALTWSLPKDDDDAMLKEDGYAKMDLITASEVTLESLKINASAKYSATEVATVQELLSRNLDLFSSVPPIARYPPIVLHTKEECSELVGCYERSRPIHNPLALKACGEILDLLESAGKIAKLPPAEDIRKVNIALRMVNEGYEADGVTTKWRLTLDARMVNRCLAVVPFPTGITAYDIVRDVAGKRYKSKLDAPKAFYALAVEDKCAKRLSAFTHPLTGERYYFKVLIMGSCNSPAYLQQFMNYVFNNTAAYIDDIPSGDITIEAHVSRLALIFDQARKANFVFNHKKCAFLEEPMEVLGRICAEEYHTPMYKSIANIAAARLPDTIKELQCILGVINWVRDYIIGCSLLLAPLTDKLAAAERDKVKRLSWTPEETTQFKELMALASKPQQLVPIDYSKPIYVRTDACNTGWGGVVFQYAGGDESTGDMKFNEIVSGKFNKTQRNWNTTEHEAYAIYATIVMNEPFLIGRHFNLATDHQALTWEDVKSLNYIREPPNKKVSRWRRALCDYWFSTVHIPGVENIHADSLSRIAMGSPSGECTNE